MNIEYIKQDSAVWIEETNSKSLNCIVKFKEFEDEQLYNVNIVDIEEHSKVLLTKILNGEAGIIASYQSHIDNLKQETIQYLESSKTEISNKILELKPDTVLPTDADFNGDGESTLTELQTLLDRLEIKAAEAAEAAFDVKYGI